MKEEIKPSVVSELSDDEKKALAQKKSEEAKKARSFDISESDKMEIAKGVSDAQAEKNETKYERRSKAWGIAGGIAGSCLTVFIIGICVRTLIGLGKSGSLVNPFGGGSTASETSYDYSDFADNKIEIKDFFAQKGDAYLVYAYSDTCAHCADIKQTVLSYAASGKFKMYFMNDASSTMKTVSSEDDCRDMTLNATEISQLSIYGTPTMYVVETAVADSSQSSGKKTVTEILIGESEIKTALANN